MRLRFFILLAGLFTLAACGPAPEQSETDLLYSLITETNSSATDCGSTGYSYSENGTPFDVGVRAQLVDATTGDNVSGSATIWFAEGSGGSLGTDELYTCHEGLLDDRVVVNAHAQGYAPVAFEAALPRNDFVTMRIPMTGSCSGTTQSCFDVVAVNNAFLGGTSVDDAREQVHTALEGILLVPREQYTLSCIECNLGRGGYIKGAGTLADGSAFTFSKRTGWCSSGGADCGYDLCLSAPAPVVAKTMSESCSILRSGITVPGEGGNPLCGGTYVDTSTETRTLCDAGEFLYEQGNRSTFSIEFNSNRCSAAVVRGNESCL